MHVSDFHDGFHCFKLQTVHSFKTNFQEFSIFWAYEKLKTFIDDDLNFSLNISNQFGCCCSLLENPFFFARSIKSSNTNFILLITFTIFWFTIQNACNLVQHQETTLMIYLKFCYKVVSSLQQIFKVWITIKENNFDGK